MKKVKTLFAALLVFMFTNTFGQTETAGEKVRDYKNSPHTYLDLMVNMVNTNIHYGGSNSALADYKKSAKGIQAGVSFQAGVTPAFSMVSELYYIRKGGNLKANQPLTGGESGLRLNTLELPVLARFHAGRFYMNAGPSIAYNFSGSRKIDGQTTKLSFDNSSSSFKRLEAGAQIGGGLEFPFKQKRIALDIRYNHGLTNIARGNEMRNRAVMVSIYFSKLWNTNPFAK